MARHTSERKPKTGRLDGWICAAIALVLVGALWLVGALSALQRMVYDSALAQTTVVAPADVVLVDIDARSLAAVRGGWTDEVHAALIDRLALGGAKTIVYTAPLAQTAAPGAQEALARSVALAGNVLWPAGFASTGAPAPLPPIWLAWRPPRKRQTPPALLLPIGWLRPNLP